MKKFYLSIVAVVLIGCASVYAVESQNTTSGSIIVDKLAQTTTSWDGTELPNYDSTKQPEITVLKYKIPKGAKLPSHFHPCINAGVLLSGAIKVTSEVTGKTYTFGPGQASGPSIVELVNEPHHGESIGDEDAVLIMVYAGYKEEPVTIKETDIKNK